MLEGKMANVPKLDLNITNRCNFRCKHCAFDSGIVEMNELSLSELEKILRDTKECGGKRIDITGGEPLVRDDVDEIIALGKRLEYKIELVTNGLLLTEQRLDKFKAIGLDGIAISLDGSTPEIYNLLRNRNMSDFYKVLENIKLSKKKGFYTKINTVVFSENINDITNITNLAIKLNVDEHGIYYFTPVGRGSRNSTLVVNPLEWLSVIERDLASYKDAPIKVSLEFPFIGREKYNERLGCIANNERSHLQILPNGDVFPCAILASHGLPVANLHNCSVKDIANNESLWNDYWARCSHIFKEFKGCCVDFSMMSDRKDYCFICPLRKFDLKEV
jgi:MoaA/NifB/PqqE/SkfB family radical SAM enzyme